MSGARKDETVQALAFVVINSRSWHSSNGYFCDRCGTECSTDVTTLCACCQDLLQVVTLPVPSFEAGRAVQT